MKAIICDTWGEPASLQLQDMPSPVPGPKQVLVRVRVAAVNFPDALIVAGDICQRTLEAQPNSQSFLAVILDGVNVPAGPDTWTYMNEKVVFQGSTCTRIRGATQTAPIQVEIRIVRVL